MCINTNCDEADNQSQDLFANLPYEIVIQILSKLPVRSIVSCKCLCKSWLGLLDSHEFVEYHLLKPIHGLAISRFDDSGLYEFFDFEDGLNLEYHDLRYKPVTKFSTPDCNRLFISGSANGLLFLTGLFKHALYLCNPITRDYIDLDCNEFVDTGGLEFLTYGFGYSKITGQHKVVRISQSSKSVRGAPPNSKFVCHVCTIGTGLWRKTSHASHLVLCRYSYGAFLNGNLHWPVSAFEGPQVWISCFDLETECFNTFSSPLLESAHSFGPTILEDCLCLCDYGLADGIAIWLMKEYRVEESWTKQYFIGVARPPQQSYYDAVYPIKIFKDGDILLLWKHKLLFYSKNNNTVQRLETIEPHDRINAFIYTPSFLSLKNFGGMEKVMSF